MAERDRALSDDHAAFEGRMHTAYKHEILRKYLRPWMVILRSTSPTIAYVDCYAGPGIYPDGTEGSPLIALQIADDVMSQFDCRIWCIFNDRDERVMEQLRNSLRDRYECEQVLVFSFQTDARDCVDQILNDERFASNGKLSVPMFFFMDPFGFNVPMQMLKRIMEQPKTEILVTFMVKDIVRWGETHAYKPTMSELFDHPNPLDLVEQADGRDFEQQAINAFVSRLHTHAGVKHVIKYRIFNEQERRTLFYLVHGSNHFKGFKLMKDVMYNIGIPGAFAYLGPDHPDEDQTFLEPSFGDRELEQLKRHLVEKYPSMSPSFGKVLEDMYAEVPFIEKHYRAALLGLEEDGKVEIFGFRRRKGTLKEGHGVTFL